MNGWPLDTVLVGVIDDGIAFAHERLRLANGRSRARRLSPLRPLPVVINISFGYTAGPHDGSGLLERFMELVVQLRPNTRFVLPAGNEHLSRCHAEIDLRAQNPVVLDWVVQPNDRTDSVVEVWLPGAPVPGVNRLTMTVTPPGAAAHVISEVSPPLVNVFDAAGTVMGLLERTTPLGRALFRLAIQPTDRAQPDALPRAPAGRWHLRFDPGPPPSPASRMPGCNATTRSTGIRRPDANPISSTETMSVSTSEAGRSVMTTTPPSSRLPRR